MAIPAITYTVQGLPRIYKNIFSSLKAMPFFMEYSTEGLGVLPATSRSRGKSPSFVELLMNSLLFAQNKPVFTDHIEQAFLENTNTIYKDDISNRTGALIYVINAQDDLYHKIETQRDIHQSANDDLADVGLEKLHLSFYLAIIYDHSIFEAFSKVVQKLILQVPTLENLCFCLKRWYPCLCAPPTPQKLHALMFVPLK
uniref:Ras-related GTP-binding protein n=1 Tax=Xenopus tropicalis TaxID=8364 RepID=A0A803J5W7_XENTR